MIIVVDTSVIVKWFVDEPGHQRARSLLQPQRELAAPDFALAEVANVLWRKQRIGDVSAKQVDQALLRLPFFFQRLSPAAELVQTALGIAREIGHSVYDCMFMAEAIALSDALLVTSDERFLAKVAGTRHEAFVQPLDTFSLPLET